MVLKLLQISYYGSSYIFRGWVLYYIDHQFQICNSIKTNIGYILDDLQISVEFLLPSDVSQIDINCCLNFPKYQRIETFKKKNYYWFFFLQWLEFKHFSMWHDDLFMVHVFFIIRCTAFDMPLKRTQKKKKKMK